MNRLLKNRLVLQLLFTLIAAVSVAALSVMLITDAVESAGSVLLSETNKTVSAAIRELAHQYHDRVTSDSSWSALPLRARDVSLRGISQTVLASYPGVEGGFYIGSEFLGYAFPTHDAGAAKTDVPSAERGWIVAVAEQSLHSHSRISRTFRGRQDLLVIDAAAGASGTAVVWAMKRLAGRNAPGLHQRELLLAALVLAALISIVGTLTTGISLARGVAQIKAGLTKLEKNFDYRLPTRSDELGEISKSVNRMASLRGQLESELRHEDRLRALGKLASGLAHEIRNPLNSIRLTVQLLEHRLKTNSIRPEDLATVRAEVDRMSLLLNDLLDLRRSRQPKVSVQPILPVLQHCTSLIERQAEMQGATIRLEATDGDGCALFDSQQLTQAVFNLLLNALEVSPHGSSIYIRPLASEAAMEVEVQDEGPGLSKDQQEHLFEAFYTTKLNGTGLGLALSRELLRSQGGDLLYRPGDRGAIFVIRLSRN